MNRNIAVLAITILFGTLAYAVNGSADRVMGLLAELERAEIGKTYVLQEADLNAFILRELQRQPQPGVQKARVRFHDGSFTTFLTVDMDEVEFGDASMTTGLIRTLLRGVQEIEVEGELEVDRQGEARYQTHGASLNGFPLPAGVVDMILSSVGKKQQPPFDPTRPFNMPYGINQVEFQTGKVLLGVK